MTENVVGNGPDIFGNDVATVLDESIRTGSLGQIDAGTGASAEGYHLLEIGELVTLRETGSEDDVGNILLYLFVYIDFADHGTCLKNVVGRDDRPDLGKTRTKILADDQLFLLKMGY